MSQNINLESLDYDRLMLDYIPIVSTFTSAYDLYQNIILQNTTEESITSREYTTLLPGSNLRNIVLLVPFLGNIVIILYDCFVLFAEEIDENATESSSNTARPAFYANIQYVRPNIQTREQVLANVENDDGLRATICKSSFQRRPRDSPCCRAT